MEEETKGVRRKAIEALIESDDFILITREKEGAKLFEYGEDEYLTASLVVTMRDSEHFENRIEEAISKLKDL